MPANEKSVDNKELTINIGDNLLKAIELILNSVEKENKNHFWRRLRPGKQVKEAFGINLTNAYKDHIKPNLSRKLT